jgi:hypothetical protein
LNFAIALPKTPTESNVEDPAADEKGYHSVSQKWNFDDGHIDVTRNTYSTDLAQNGKTAATFCQSVKDSAKSQPLMKILSETGIRSPGVPGCELTVSVGGQATAIYRFYVVGDQLFDVVVTIYHTDPEEEKFARSAIDTFRILKP